MVTPEEFSERYPLVWHMAETANWSLIQEHGLLSTSALLDLFEYGGTDRAAVEASCRGGEMILEHPLLGRAIVRDQRPMISDEVVARFLDDLTPAGWYASLNRRVFFWLSVDRLGRMLGAPTYRDRPHTTLAVDTAGLLERHLDRIALSPLNSGAIFPGGRARRGPQTFSRFADFPWEVRRRTNAREPVLELAVDYAVPDIMEILQRVETRQAQSRD